MERTRLYHKNIFWIHSFRVFWLYSFTQHIWTIKCKFILPMAHNLTLPFSLWSLNIWTTNSGSLFFGSRWTFLTGFSCIGIWSGLCQRLFHLNLKQAHVHSPCHMEHTHQSVFSKSTFILSWGVSPLKCTNNSRWIRDVSLPLKSCCKVIVIVWLPCVGQLTVLDILTKYSWGMVGGARGIFVLCALTYRPRFKKQKRKRERLERIKVTVSCKSLFMVFCLDEVLCNGNGPNALNLSKMAANLNELMGDICEESL